MVLVVLCKLSIQDSISDGEMRTRMEGEVVMNRKGIAIAVCTVLIGISSMVVFAASSGPSLEDWYNKLIEIHTSEMESEVENELFSAEQQLHTESTTILSRMSDRISRFLSAISGSSKTEIENYRNEYLSLVGATKSELEKEDPFQSYKEEKILSINEELDESLSVFLEELFSGK